MPKITVDIDVPNGVNITHHRRVGSLNFFEVTWEWPDVYQCEKCGHQADDAYEILDIPRFARDVDMFGMPCYWVYKVVIFRCKRCHSRQHVIPPFKRKDTKYTFRFEEQVLRMLAFSTMEETARRNSISAEMVAFIVKNQLSEAREIDPSRVITSIGMDEISLKKRHKMYVTILTDLSDPECPQVLAVAKGKDEDAASACLKCLSPAQREAVKSYRVDMGSAFNAACAKLLPNAQGVTDRFHVAKLWNEAIDGERKKNHEGIQEDPHEGGAEGVSFADVGVSSGQERSDAQGTREIAGALRTAAATEDAV